MPTWGREMPIVHNARVNLLATAVNNVALASCVAGFVAPMASGQIASESRLLLGLAWIGIGIVLHGCGQLLPGGLRQ